VVGVTEGNGGNGGQRKAESGKQKGGKRAEDGGQRKGERGKRTEDSGKRKAESGKQKAVREKDQLSDFNISNFASVSFQLSTFLILNLQGDQLSVFSFSHFKMASLSSLLVLSLVRAAIGPL
jgi:hypothetical protein